MIGRLAVGVLGVGAACLAWGIGIERTAFQVRRFSAAVLPPGSEPLKLLHVSDIHLVPRQTRKRDFLRGLAGLQPDLVVTTGDNVSSPDSIEPLIDSLGRLVDVPGVFVFGSNDFERPRFRLPIGYLFGRSKKEDRPVEPLPADAQREALEAIGWTYVEERRAELQIAGQTVRFRGTGDAHHDRDDYPAVAGPASDDVLEIGVTHAPYQRILDAMTADGVPLILAGHTHGGQVCIPGRGAIITNCDLPRENAKGMFEHTAAGRRAQVHVSAGVGMSPFAPYRFACPPEVTLLTLVPRADPM